jgi:hypothetical protein
MLRQSLLLALFCSSALVLSACGDGQPLFDEDDDGGTCTTDCGGDGGDDGGDGNLSVDLPPGTDDPRASGDILRFEERNESGGGLVTDVSYNRQRDTFSVDNLGFDGQGPYDRGDDVASMGGYAVYDADIVVEDFLTGEAVDQIVPYRAILGVSTNRVDGDRRTSFAIVRTGGYVPYGFGGFIYERNGSVVLPEPGAGQAVFTGDYAGMRVFDGIGGLEFTRGDMEIAIDFNDFNANEAVRGVLTNRAAFDEQGNRIRLGGDDDALVLPDLPFVIQEGAQSLNEDGELAGLVANGRLLESGTVEEYETGVYYGIIAGDLTDRDDGGEIVGILVIDSTDPRFDVPVQETGGFILYR